jgi:multidrug efflux pump
MHAVIAGAFARRTATVLLLVLVLVGGAWSYATIPKEAAPEIEIPLFNVSVVYSGISAEDSARLLVRPMERQLSGISGLRKMTALAGEGFAHIRLEFTPGGDHQRALQDVRDAVELAEADLPPGAEPARVTEIDLSLFPVVTATLSGPVSERVLLTIARDLQDRVEALPGVLEVEIAGDREDLMEILVDPVAVESYRLSYGEVAQAVERNNRLIAAGALATGEGRVPVSIPGVIEGIADVLATPVLVVDGTVVTLQDVAVVRQTFKDADGFARVDGDPTIALEVRKQAGANVIETVAAAQRVIEEARAGWPAEIDVGYLQNQADDIADLLGDLENSVAAAILLVMLTVVLALGVRASILVAIAIPGAFLAGILTINAIGFTLNIVVLFSLILVIGMLVDGGIVVVELAQRHLSGGVPPALAFRRAATRMAWPVTASIATTLAVFVPLLLWPGTAGQFMRFLPATVLITLTASLLMALVFVPVLGSLMGRVRGEEDAAGEPVRPGAATRRYEAALARLVRRPGLVLAGTFGLLVAMYALYGAYGRGVDFFPAVEPQFAQVQIQTQGNLSVWEADAHVRSVERELVGVPGVRLVYARTICTTRARMGANLSEDTVGIIQLDLADWREREPASVLIQRWRERVGDIPGLEIQIREQRRGPGRDQPVEIEVGAREAGLIVPAVDRIRALMAEIGGFVDVADDRPLAAVEIRVNVDRQEAARYGADVATLGNAVQLLTTGILLGSYRPDFTDEEVELRLRFPPEARHVGQLANLRVLTPRGLVPIANFTTLEAVPLTGLITRVDGVRVHTVTADVAPGELVSERIAALERAIEGAGLDPGVTVAFRGQAEDQAEAAAFLLRAFVIAVFLMLLILVLQLDSLFQALLVLSAIVFSTAGVLLGLLVRQEPFGVVMSGMGVIALAGIVVNNNIVLIDAYNEHRGNGLPAREAALRAGVERLRPVLLTAITTIVGLSPMALGLTIDFMGRDLSLGAPSTQFWIQLATAIIGGLAVATPVTVLFTPCMLVWRDGRREPGHASAAPAATRPARG